MGAASMMIIAQPGRLRDGLLALARALPGIGTVEAMDDGEAALRAWPARPATLVLLEAALPGGEAEAVLEQLKKQQPQPQCILLVDYTRNSQATARASDAAVLVKGFSGADLAATVERLLARQEGAAPK